VSGNWRVVAALIGWLGTLACAAERPRPAPATHHPTTAQVPEPSPAETTPSHSPASASANACGPGRSCPDLDAGATVGTGDACDVEIKQVVVFFPGSAEVPESASSVLDAVAELAVARHLELVVVGSVHRSEVPTGARATARLEALSKGRAEHVKEELKRRGVADDRLTTKTVIVARRDGPFSEWRKVWFHNACTPH
jgi:outer membrane protein OmpA-like peptidoglycan-associated protein